jgi:hypothetical protein
MDGREPTLFLVAGITGDRSSRRGVTLIEHQSGLIEGSASPASRV